MVLDEWLLYPLKKTEAQKLLEIAESRYKNASTIFLSQFALTEWREKIGDPILADAICDRIVPTPTRWSLTHAQAERRAGAEAKIMTFSDGWLLSARSYCLLAWIP